jgi:integrase
MPSGTPVETRDRAFIAFSILTGARDGALASFRLKHVDMAAKTVFQDAREVSTKRRKTVTSTFLPLGPEPLAIVADYMSMLKREHGFGPDHPLFPATRIGHGADRAFEEQGLSHQHSTTAEPIGVSFAQLFAAAGLPYANPHSFRKTLVVFGRRICRTPEEWKAWSQNLGHESETTTFVGYGQVPSHRQAEIMRRSASPGPHGKRMRKSQRCKRLWTGSGRRRPLEHRKSDRSFTCTTAMVTRWGFSDELGTVMYGDNN